MVRPSTRRSSTACSRTARLWCSASRRRWRGAVRSRLAALCGWSAQIGWWRLDMGPLLARRHREVVAEAHGHGRLVAPDALAQVVGDERLELGLRGQPALDEEAAARPV